MKKTILGIETLESKRTLSSVSVASAPLPAAPVAAQVRVQQTNPVLYAPGCVGIRQGTASLGCISVAGSENPKTMLVVAAGRGATITSAIRDPNVRVSMTTNAVGGTVVYIEGNPSAITRNMKYLTYRGPESPIRVQLWIRNPPTCVKYADVNIPVRRA